MRSSPTKSTERKLHCNGQKALPMDFEQCPSHVYPRLGNHIGYGWNPWRGSRQSLGSPSTGTKIQKPQTLLANHGHWLRILRRRPTMWQVSPACIKYPLSDQATTHNHCALPIHALGNGYSRSYAKFSTTTLPARYKRLLQKMGGSRGIHRNHQ